MKKSILFLGIISLSIFSVAQESSDYGVFLGMSQEHAQTILPVPAQTPLGLIAVAPAFGAFYRKNLNPRYSLRFGANYGINSAYYSEALLINPSALAVLVSGVSPQAAPSLMPLDIHALFEFNFLPLNPRLETPKVSTFVATGIGIYQLSPVIPFNVGVKYRITERLGLSAEWDLRRRVFGSNNPLGKLDPQSNWYSYIGISANYNVLKTCKTCPFYQSNRKRKR